MLTKRVVDANGPSHPLLSLDRREHLGRVLERDGSLAERVRYCEEVDESRQVISNVRRSDQFGGNLQDDRPYLFATTSRCLQQRQTGSQEEDAHEGKRLERELSFRSAQEARCDSRSGSGSSGLWCQ